MEKDGIEFNPGRHSIRYSGHEIVLHPTYYGILEVVMPYGEILTPEGFADIFRSENDGEDPWSAKSLLSDSRKRLVKLIREEWGLDLDRRLRTLYGLGLVYIEEAIVENITVTHGVYAFNPLKQYLTLDGQYLHLNTKLLRIFHRLYRAKCRPVMRTSIISELEDEGYTFGRGLLTLQEDLSHLGKALGHTRPLFGDSVLLPTEETAALNSRAFPECRGNRVRN